MKHDKNAASRITGFELVSKWVREKIVLCASFVRIQGIIENQLEAGGRGNRVSVRHKGEVRN